MRRPFVAVLLICLSKCTIAQKKLIDSSVYGKWPTVENLKISNDGKFVIYTVGSPSLGSNLRIQALDGNWKMEIKGSNSYRAAIVQNSRYTVFAKPNDSLGIINMETGHEKYVSNVNSFAVSKDSIGKWLAYKFSNLPNGLVLVDMASGDERYFPEVTNYLFSDNGKVLLLETEEKTVTGTTRHKLKWVDLERGKVLAFFSGVQMSNFVFDSGGTRIAFLSDSNKTGKYADAIWLYSPDMDNAVKCLSDRSPLIDAGLKILYRRPLRFGMDGRKIFFKLARTNVDIEKLKRPKVDIWNYKDSRLQSQQLEEAPERNFEAVINIQNGRLIRLEEDNEQIIRGLEKNNDEYVLVDKKKGDVIERYWNLSSISAIYLVSTETGMRILLNDTLKASTSYFRLSPNCNWLIYYDSYLKNYFSYNIPNRKFINVTSGISVNWTGYESYDRPDSSFEPIGLAAWLEQDQAVLIYDRFDIWQIDLGGTKRPVNITDGFGRKNDISFWLANETGSHRSFSLSQKSVLLLTALDRKNKYNGYYKKQLGLDGPPDLLTMGPFMYSWPPLGYSNPLIKATDVDRYVVIRMNTTESPNYFWTKNFKSFNPISDVEPQKEYNWMTSELVHWRAFDGNISTGILYKPENFDARKKYPVIIYVYERLSDQLNLFLKPEMMSGPIDIPIFVSNGYLVFEPDIHYKMGFPGESAYNYVVSAAGYLSGLSWVDSAKMGIQGHSFGGFEVNFLVSHSKIFAAACSASGLSDCVSGYNDVGLGERSLQSVYEMGQMRIGVSPWQNRELFIKNSPVFNADKVQTPLLMMNNKGDGSVPFVQGVEFFTALRRLHKKVWMLQYDGGAHQLYEEGDMRDFSERVKQFFDHYLKGALPPKWMTEGVPAKMKGIESGLEPDLSGKQP